MVDSMPGKQGKEILLRMAQRLKLNCFNPFKINVLSRFILYLSTKRTRRIYGPIKNNQGKESVWRQTASCKTGMFIQMERIYRERKSNLEWGQKKERIRNLKEVPFIGPCVVFTTHLSMNNSSLGLLGKHLGQGINTSHTCPIANQTEHNDTATFFTLFQVQTKYMNHFCPSQTQ